MAISKNINRYEKGVLKLLKLDYKGLRLCELGNQRITPEGTPAKEIYSSLGAEHISIDLNGNCGAMPLNLDMPLPFIFLNQFDVVTNYGTIEHVTNQYQVFKSTHDICKTGGIMIHVLPLIGNWPKHCRYYYSRDFVYNLAKECNYKIISYKTLNKEEYEKPNNMIAVAFVKTKNEFITKKKFDSIKGLLDTGDILNTGFYDNKIENKIKKKIVHLLKAFKVIAVYKYVKKLKAKFVK